MKKVFSIILIALFTHEVIAQVPNKMSYQLVIRDAFGMLVINQTVSLRISILQGSITGNPVYSEIHTAMTNTNGLASVEIGGGSVLIGNFSNIAWADDNYFVKTETDPSGSNNYSITGTSQLLSVPYALYAKSAENLSNGLTISSVSTNGDTLHLSNGETFVAGGSGTGSLVFPTITTNTVIDITSNSARFGGTINNANGNQIMERGFVYKKTPNPTIHGNKIIVGDGVGTFDTLSGLGYQYPHLLASSTTYYVRAYAITENNIVAYGNEVSFTTLTIGQSGPSGGIIFFDKGNNNDGWQYLEAATNDQSSSTNWGCYGTQITGTQLTVGSGENNTALIVGSCNEPNFAAKLCSDLILGGQSDWFLPSRDELHLMFINLHLNNQGNFYSGNYWPYWSSSEYDANNAFNYSFYSSGSGYMASNKNSMTYVRAIRAF